MHLLLSAYACDPVNGSEPGVGWQVLKAALDVCDSVTLLTRRNNVQEIVAALSSDELRRCNIVAHDLGGVSTRLKRILPLGTQSYYLLWQLTARRVVSRLHRLYSFDVAHHATFAIDWMPTAVDPLTRTIPVVWGPVGGSTHAPVRLFPALGIRGAIFEALRWCSNRAGVAHLRRRRVGTYALCIAQNDDVANWLARHNKAVTCEPNAFIEVNSLPSRDPRSTDPDLLVGVGRLIPWKGWSLAIMALMHLPATMRLELLGAGPDEGRLRQIATRHGVSDRVVFRGRVSREETLSSMARAHAMVFPSLHDSASTAMGEALSIGCPLVALPLGGSPVMLSRSGGRLVELEDVPRQIAMAVLDPAPVRDLNAWNADRLSGLITQWYRQAREPVQISAP